MGKIAFAFAGQGAQYSGMGRSLCESSAAARDIFARAERLLPNIKALCFEGDESSLSQTLNTQPCLFTVDLAAAAAASEAGIRADMAAGFSLGELAAVVFAGMLTFEQGFELVRERAAFMQRAAEQRQGAMLAVLRLSSERVTELTREFEQAYPANFNCPAQTVVSLAESECEPFAQRVKAAGGRCVRLKVNGAFHSPFMDEAAAQFSKAADKLCFKAPRLPVYANVSARPYAAETAAETLSAQIRSAVRWEETLRAMQRDGADTIIELGAGKTLTGLAKKTDPALAALSIEDAQTLSATKEYFINGRAN